MALLRILSRLVIAGSSDMVTTTRTLPARLLRQPDQCRLAGAGGLVVIRLAVPDGHMYLILGCLLLSDADVYVVSSVRM